MKATALNESNRFVMSRNPVDLRKGVDSLCGAIRSCHLDSLNGDVYVFAWKSVARLFGNWQFFHG